MISSLDEYIHNFKIKLKENMFSPQFIRLANLYYLNKQYEECISTCKTGLEIYPNYLTAKLLLLKAFIKMEYINEAENLLDEVRDKITNTEILKNLENSIYELEHTPRQERIHYAPKHEPIIEFSSYEEIFMDFIDTEPKIDLDLFLSKLDNNDVEDLLDESAYKAFTENFKELTLDIKEAQIESTKRRPDVIQSSAESSDSHISKIKIVTETLADLFAQQGNFKEAFNTYNILLKEDNSNKERILKKLSNLESNFLSHKHT